MNPTTSTPTCYLAAPFFNSVQKGMVTKLEKVIEGCGYDCYSPSRDGTMCPPTAPREEREKAFYGNNEAMDESDIVVAWIDWLLPEGQEVRVVENAQDVVGVPFPEPFPQLIAAGMKATGMRFGEPERTIITPGEASGGQMKVPSGINMPLPDSTKVVDYVLPIPLNLPDSGTVWEMGYVFAKGIPTFTVSVVGGKQNLMLAESVVSHSTALDSLRAALDTFHPVSQWKRWQTLRREGTLPPGIIGDRELEEMGDERERVMEGLQSTTRHEGPIE